MRFYQPNGKPSYTFNDVFARSECMNMNSLNKIKRKCCIGAVYLKERAYAH